MTDALLLHLRMDLATDWTHPPAPLADALPYDPALHDAYAVHDARVHPDDAGRHARTTAALAEIRRLAAAAAPLRFDELQRVQALVLGAPAPFRAGDAFGRAGR